MKKVCLFTALLFISVISFSQDIISLKRGKRVEAIVTGKTPTLVRYKLFSEPNGREYFVYKDDVSGIMYRNGKVESFDQPAIEKDAGDIGNSNQITTSTDNNRNLYQNTNSITPEVTGRNFRSTSSRAALSPRRGLQRGYKGMLEWGYSFGAGGDYGTDRLYLNFINGAQFNPYFSFGAGVGVHYYFSDRYYYLNNFYYNNDFVLIPVFADFRINFIDKPVSPYLAIDLGYSFNASDNLNSFGLFESVAVGASFKVSRFRALHVGLGYEIQWIHYSNADNGLGDGLGALSLKFGFSF